MSRYIDADALSKTLATVAKRLAKSDAQKALMGRVFFIIDHWSEDADPVVHGRWVCIDTDAEQFFVCSKCDKKEYWESEYCPNCGARMDG